jgi:hypothetical protein
MSAAMVIKILIVLSLGCGAIAVVWLRERSAPPPTSSFQKHVMTEQERKMLDSLKTVAPKDRGEMH